MPRIERDRELARRRTRKVKLKKLAAKFAKTTNSEERDAILAKARRMSPMINWAERFEAAAQ